MRLFLTEIQAHGNSFKVEVLAQFVFQERQLGILDGLRRVEEKCNRWRLGRQLRYELYFDILTLVNGWRPIFDDGQHDLIQA